MTRENYSRPAIAMTVALALTGSYMGLTYEQIVEFCTRRTFFNTEQVSDALDFLITHGPMCQLSNGRYILTCE